MKKQKNTDEINGLLGGEDNEIVIPFSRRNLTFLVSEFPDDIAKISKDSGVPVYTLNRWASEVSQTTR